MQSKSTNRKTAGGMKRFLVGWLNRATERGGGRSHQTPTAAPPQGETIAEKAKRLRAEMDAARDPFGGDP